MKIFIHIIRWIVGLLFIFSGMIKANDPLGLSYKMQEFFVAWNIHWFDNYTLALSLVMNVFEVVAGVALIVGWRMKLFTRLLLILIIFFSFLTGYALLSGKIKECGCFGDCVPLTNLTTFLKDVFLFILILILCFAYKKITPLFNRSAASAIVLIFAVLFVCITEAYVLKHLPVLDCLPYKIGKNISEEMKMPANAKPDSVVMIFKYKKDGKEIEFDENHFPANLDSSYEFVDRFDKVVREGTDMPVIADFSVRTLSGNDTTAALLSQPNKYVLMFTQNFKNWNDQQEAFGKVVQKCIDAKISLFIITSSPEEGEKLVDLKAAQILRCDNTVVRTAARVNGTYFYMQSATILDKKSYADVDEFILRMK